MSYLNRFFIIGNITKAPERKTTKKGHSYCLLFVAQTKKWTTASGERKESVFYFNFNVYARLGEILLASDIKPWDRIYLEGEIEPYKMENTDWQSYFGHRFSVNNFSFLDSHNSGSHQTTNAERIENLSRADDFNDLT